MFFSVIVPVYNVKQYLKGCLDSLVNQTCSDKEIILIDDGSTDSSGKICEEYAKKYDFIKVIHQKNQGLSGARNTGLKIAKGKWICFVDSDDWVDTDMLEKLQGYILAKNADMYRFGFIRSYASTKKKDLIRPKRHTITYFKSEEELFQFYSNNYYLLLMAWRGVYRRKIILEHHLQFVDTKEIFAEDTLFNYHYFLHIKSLVTLPYAPYHYLKHANSLCTATSAEQRLLRCITLGEYAFRAIVEQKLTYFEENFYKHYSMIIDMRVWNSIFIKKIPKERIKKVLDEMLKNDFHLSCVKKLIQEGTPHVFLSYSSCL